MISAEHHCVREDWLPAGRQQASKDQRGHVQERNNNDSEENALPSVLHMDPFLRHPESLGDNHRVAEATTVPHWASQPSEERLARSVPLFGGSDANTKETVQSPLPTLFRTAANHGSKISQSLSVSRTLALWPAMVK